MSYYAAPEPANGSETAECIQCSTARTWAAEPGLMLARLPGLVQQSPGPMSVALAPPNAFTIELEPGLPARAHVGEVARAPGGLHELGDLGRRRTRGGDLWGRPVRKALQREWRVAVSEREGAAGA